MLGMYIETPGRCGGGAPQRPSFSPAASPGGWCPAPGSPFVLCRSCRPRCCCRTRSRIIDRYRTALLCVDVGNIRDPFAVGPVRMELAVQQVFVFMYLLPHVDPLPAPADLRQQTVFFHDTQDGFGIAVYAFGFSTHQPHPAVAVCVRKLRSCCWRDRFPPEPRPFSGLPSPDGQNHSIRFGIHRKKRHIDGYWIFRLDDDGSLRILPLASLPFYGLQKIPQQLVFHL